MTPESPLVEEALGRTLAYLRLAGVTVTPEVGRRALRVVERTLTETPGDVARRPFLERVMDALEEDFELPRPPLPEGAPPVARGRIRYTDRR